MSNNIFPFNNDSFDNFYDKVDNFVRGSVNSAKNFFMDNYRLDIQEDDEKYVVEAELPGVAKEDISVTIDEGKLVISVIRTEEVEDTKENYVHKERRYGAMKREVFLKDVDDDSTSARMKDGILYVTVSKIPTEDNSRKVNID